MAEIQWGLLQTPDFLGGALKAQAAGRQQAAINALKGYSTDPAGTIQRLISAGDVQSAGALATLGYQQQQRDLLAQGARALFGQPGQAAPQAQPQPGGAPGQPPAAADPSAPGASQSSPVDPVAAGQRLEQLDTTAQLLSSVPYGPERKQALQQAVPELTKLGFAPDQIAGFDPTDQALESIREQVAKAHQQLGTDPAASSPAPADQTVSPPAPAIEAGAPQAEAPAQDQPPAAPQAAPAAAQPGTMNIYDPRTQQALGLISMGAPQIGSALVNLGAAVAPKFSGGERPGSAIIDQHTGRPVGFAPNTEGVQYVVDGQGNVIGVRSIPGYAGAAANYEAQVTGAKTHAEHAAGAPYEMVTVELPDGSKVQMTLDQFKAVKSSNMMPSLGVSQTPGDEEYQKDDAKYFADEVNAHGAQAIMGLQNARSVTEQAIHLAQTLQPNAGTELMGNLAGAVNAATGGHIGAKEANQVSTYEALLPQVLRGTLGGGSWPRLDKEFHVIAAASAGVNTPKDAAQILLATQAATQARNLAYANFVANYQGPHSKTALTKAWMAQPAANASIFSDPVWRGVTIDGKPAVRVGDRPLPDGHVYGVFMPGTPNAQTFMVR